jgi:hypothetical protein
MTNEEIIEVKSNEIRRLHKIYQEKETELKTLINICKDIIGFFDLDDQSGYTFEQKRNLRVLKNFIKFCK